MKVKIVAVLTVILLIVVMCVPVYADTTIPQIPSGGWQYWIVATEWTDEIIYITSHNPITVAINAAGVEGYSVSVNTFKYYRYENDRWKLIFENEIPIEPPNKQYFSFKNMYQSNHNIAYEDGTGFFFLRPRASRLYPTMKETDSGTIWRTFSVGLIPIIGCLILVISLRKGWEFLRTQLKN